MKSIMSGMNTIIMRCWLLSPVDGVIEPDSVEMPQTRQMRRHP